MPTKTRTTKSKSPAEIKQEVTDRIIKALEAGTVPWRKPWKVAAGSMVFHHNFASKYVYRGINQWLLTIEQEDKGYEHNQWLTFKQAKALGGTVKKGEKATHIILVKPILVPDKEKSEAEGREIKKRIWLTRYPAVFNVEQCEGFEDKLVPVEQPEAPTFTPIQAAEAICDGFEDGPKVRHGQNRAYYSPRTDMIGLPDPTDFDAEMYYYATRFHEMVHSTGAEKRTGRVTDWTGFGEDPYAKEELVAEMGAAMLSGLAGIDVEDLHKQEAAYIQSWIRRFKNDSKLLVSAGAQAHTAIDHILGNEVKKVDNDA